jgi:hypothetical protein
MVDMFTMDPFSGASEIPGLETFNPFGQTVAMTEAALYAPGCEPTDINVNCVCSD